MTIQQSEQQMIEAGCKFTAYEAAILADIERIIQLTPSAPTDV